MKGHWIAVIFVGVMILGTLAFSAINAQGQYSIPSWVKGVAGFWAEDKITDADFGEGLSFLIDNEIIKVPKIQSLKNEVAQLQSENKNLKGDVTFLENENADLRNQLAYLNKPIQNTPSQSYEPKTTEQKSSLNYPKVTKRIDGNAASETLGMIAEFHESLTTTEKNELVNRAVDQSQFTVGILFGGNWILTVTEGNFDFIQYEGFGISVIPFDCSHNMEYIYSIVGQKEDETGKISLYLFKNGVWIDNDESEKPYGISTIAGACDEPSIFN